MIFKKSEIFSRKNGHNQVCLMVYFPPKKLGIFYKASA
jgi:hypothetical protein